MEFNNAWNKADTPLHVDELEVGSARRQSSDVAKR